MSLLEKSSSIELSRKSQQFESKKGSYSLGQTVQIEVDVQREYLDFQNSRLVFDVVFGASTGSSYNDWFASQIVQNLRVKTLGGQMIGQEIREYRSWCQMYKELSSNSDLNDSYFGVMEGANSASLVDGGSTIQFAHKFMSHIFSIQEYYPAHFHQGFMIEFDLPSNIDELCNAGTLPASITIDRPRYVADLVQLKPEIENEMVRLMEEQKLFVDYTEVLTQENPLTTGTGLKSYDVVGIDGRVKGIFTYTIQDADRNTDDEPYFATWGRNGLSSYRYKLGSNYLNYESIAVGANKRAEQTMELMKALDIHDNEASKSKAGDSALTPALLDSNRFCVAKKVDKTQKDSDESISSAIDKDRNNVRVELNFGSSPTVGQIITHIHLDKRIQILPGSLVRNVRS